MGAVMYAVTHGCATRHGAVVGGIILLVLVLTIVGCAIGWGRASNRAHRAEAALHALRRASTSSGRAGGPPDHRGATPADPSRWRALTVARPSLIAHLARQVVTIVVLSLLLALVAYSWWKRLGAMAAFAVVSAAGGLAW